MYIFTGLILDTEQELEQRRGKDRERERESVWGVRGNDRRSQTVATPDGNSFCSLQTEVGTV